MLKYKIKQVVSLDAETVTDKLGSQLKAAGYHIRKKTETFISFDNDDNSSEIVSRGYFFDKVDKGKIEIIKKHLETIILLEYSISIEPLLILIFILIVGAVIVSYKVFFLLPVIVMIYLYRIYITKKRISEILNIS